jgi:hypothetical protein
MVSSSHHLRTETSSFRNVVFSRFLEFQAMDKIQNPSNYEYFSRLDYPVTSLAMCLIPGGEMDVSLCPHRLCGSPSHNCNDYRDVPKPGRGEDIAAIWSWSRFLIQYQSWRVYLLEEWRLRMKNEMWSRVALVGTDVSEIRIASIIRMKRIGEVGTMLAVTRNWSTLRRNADYVRKEAIEWNTRGMGGGEGVGFGCLADH